MILVCSLALLLSACGNSSTTGEAPSTPPTTPPGSSAPVLTPPAATPTPATTARWSDPAVWPSGHVPAEGETVTVPAGQTLLLDVSPPRLAGLTIPTGSALVFKDADLDLRTDWIMVHGTLAAGTESQPLTHQATITLTNATPGEDVMGMGDRVIGVMGGTLDLHGENRTAWTRLARTATKGATELQLQEAPSWRPGDTLAIASTDYDPAQTEVVTVQKVSGALVTLSTPLKYTHWASTETYGAQSTDERAEVGLLSRNVVVRGDTDSVNSGIGGQIMVMQGSTARIEGAELTRMGQRNTLRRYPIHFHMAGSMRSSYVRGNSLHELFNRCLTVHGTNDLLVQRNVTHDVVGHCFFMEDGAETGNTFDSNLAMFVRKPDSKRGETPLLTSDKNPAAFWITNPANTYVGNVAAGVQGFGFWYAMPTHPTGLSAANGADTWPRRTPLTAFRNNTAHSTDGTGLNVDNGNGADGTTTETFSYTPRTTPADAKSAPVEAVFENFTAYKNRVRGVWLRGDAQRVRGGVLSDNAIGATFAANNVEVEGTLFVGETSNAGAPASWEKTGEGGRSLPQPWDAAFPIRGFEFYDGTVTARNVTFAKYLPNAVRPASGLGYNRRNAFPLSPMNSASGLTWLDSSNHVWLETPLADKDGDKAATFRDADGSVTGTAGKYVVATSPLLNAGDCARRDAWNASVCSGPFGRFWLQAVSAEALGDITVTGAGGTLSLHGTPGTTPTYSTTLPVSGQYALNLPGSAHMRLGFQYVTPGQTLRLTLPFSGTPRVYRDWWIDNKNLLRRVTPAELDATTGDAYAQDGNILYLKLVVKDKATSATLDVCTTDLCK